MWAHLFTGEALGEKWRWYRVTEGGEGGKRGPPETENLLCGRGQQRCNEDWDRHQPGVMLHQLRGWEREEKVSQTKNGAWNNQGKADPTPGSAGLIYSLLFLVYSSANLSPEKMQSSPTAHCTLFFTTGYSCDKSRWNMRSCHLPSVQTRHGCKGSVCALQKTLFVSYSYSRLLLCLCLVDAYLILLG